MDDRCWEAADKVGMMMVDSGCVGLELDGQFSLAEL